ncbi:MAG: hypothetical protein HGGPFJEG_00302 [Ignavibacteria bacterium]|nr:hypothetical protein [Ignavibacteria bacterium]
MEKNKLFSFKRNKYKISVLLFFALSMHRCSENIPVNGITASGNIEAVEVMVSSKSTGNIKEIFVKEGDVVKTGDLLFVIDHDLLDIQLRQAEAQMEQMQAQLNLLLAGPRKEDVALAEEQLNLAEINLNRAETDKNRAEELLQTNTIPKQQYDDAFTKYEQTLNQLNTAKENLKRIKNIVRPEEIQSSRAALKISKVNIDLIKKNIEDCTIKSPVSGIVSKKISETGEFVTPGASVLSIADFENVDLYIYVTEENLGKVKLGQKAEVKTDSYKDRVYTGEVVFISPEAEFTPKNIQTQEERTKLVFEIKVKIPNPDFTLKSGMPADARLITN